MLQEPVELGLEGRVGLGYAVGGVQFVHQRHQGFGHIAAAEIAEAAVSVGIGRVVVGSQGHVH